MARFPHLPKTEDPVIGEWARELVRALEREIQPVPGGVFELTPNSDVTTVADPAIVSASKIAIGAASAAAAAELDTTFILEADVLDAQFLVNHANNATTGRRFFYTATTE